MKTALEKTGSGLKRPVTHGSPSGSFPQRWQWWDDGVGHPPPWHVLGTSVPWLCQDLGHAGNVMGSELSAATKRGTRAAGGAAECGPTGLWRSLSRSAGFLERLEPAPAPAASREVLPAPAEPCTAPGRGPEPAGQAQPADGTRRARSLLRALCRRCGLFWGNGAPWNQGKSSPFPPGGILQSVGSVP